MRVEDYEAKFDSTGMTFGPSLFSIQFTNLTTAEADKAEAQMDDYAMLGHREGDVVTMLCGGIEVNGVHETGMDIQCDMTIVAKAAKA